MSDARSTESALIGGRSSVLEGVSAGVVGIGFGTFVACLAALFRVVTIDTTVMGARLIDLFGIGLVVMGVAVVGLGVASALGVFRTDAEATAGLAVGVLFGCIGFVAAGLIASQTFGVGPIGWVLGGVLVGVGAVAVGIVPREDLGSTLPAGALAVGVGLAFLVGVLGVDWSWSPAGFSATFTASATVPLLTAFCTLVAAWAAAKANMGFGSRGRQRGAYLLVSLNVLGMLGLLVVVVAFIASKGIDVLFRGFEVGLGVGPAVAFGVRLPVDWPFVMHGHALLNDINGVFPAIVGTVWIVLGAVLFAVPLGVGAAVFLTEYAEQGRFTAVVETVTNGLWSTPSVVFGLFGFAFLVPRFGNSTSLFSGMLVLGFMLLPLVVITSREALMGVPDEYRDASAALGVSQWETVRSVVLPAAVPGIVTGVILGVGRIAGETAPLLLVLSAQPFPDEAPDVIGSFEFMASPPFVTNPVLLESASALPYQLYAIIAAGVGENMAFAWGTALTLLLVVFSFYAAGIAIRVYFRRKLRQE